MSYLLRTSYFELFSRAIFYQSMHPNSNGRSWVRQPVWLSPIWPGTL